MFIRRCGFFGMGLILSRIRKVRKIVFLGLTGSGKSSIINVLEKMYNKTEIEAPTPTRGFKVTLLRDHGRCTAIWELGGDEKTVQFWRCYLTNTRGVVFVIDGANAENKHEAMGLICDISQEKSLEHSAILVMVHKSEAEIDISEIAKNGVHIFGRRKFKVFATNTENPDTIIRAFEWLYHVIR